MNTCGSFGSSFLARSMVTMRLGSPTWIAASPMPGAAYMVSNISSTSLRVAASTLATGLETSRSRLSGKIRMSRTAIERDLRAGLRTVNVFCLFLCIGGSESRKTRPWKPPSSSPSAWLSAWPSRRLPCSSAPQRTTRRGPAAAAAAELADQRIVELGARVQAMGELLAKAQTQLQSSVHERLDAVTPHLGTSMQTATKHTTENLQKLNERLAVIDSAQKNITDLASQVTSLRERAGQQADARRVRPGPHGKAIIQDGLPKGAYEFQHTLSNRTRPDCCVFMPDKRPLVIDAKFPLEAVTAFRDGKTDDERKFAAQRLRPDASRHVADIARNI